jgi:hypothetical protein
MTRSVIITSPFGPAQAFRKLEDQDDRWELTLITAGGERPGGVWPGEAVVEAVREVTAA